MYVAERDIPSYITLAGYFADQFQICERPLRVNLEHGKNTSLPVRVDLLPFPRNVLLHGPNIATEADHTATRLSLLAIQGRQVRPFVIVVKYSGPRLRI